MENHPNRAYCIYCEKMLHAHRISLFKHTCTSKHEKAAEQQTNKINNDKCEPKKFDVISKLKKIELPSDQNNTVEILDIKQDDFVEEIGDEILQQQVPVNDEVDMDETDEEDYTHDSYNGHNEVCVLQFIFFYKCSSAL